MPAMKLKLQHDVSDRLYAWLVELTKPDRKGKRLVFRRVSFIGHNITITGAFTHMDQRIETNQKIALEVVALDSRGNPARVESPSWSSSDEAVATVAVDAENPLKATAFTRAEPPAPGEVLSADISCTADADLDVDETRPIVATITLLLVESEAVTFEMSAG